MCLLAIETIYDFFNVTWIYTLEIDRTNLISEKNIIIGVIYRPPNTEISHFIDTMKDIMDKIKNETKICYLVGDYNINLINVDLHGLTSEFSDIIYSGGFRVRFHLRGTVAGRIRDGDRWRLPPAVVRFHYGGSSAGASRIRRGSSPTENGILPL